MIPVYLKFHNNGGQSVRSMEYMLSFWRSVFFDYELTIISEDNSVTEIVLADNSFIRVIPKFKGYEEGDWQINVLNHIINGEKNWINPALANLTPTVDTKAPYFWIVDADDIYIDVKNLDGFGELRKKIKTIESLTIKNDLYFSTIDLNYTHHTHLLLNNPSCINWGHSSFGVTLMQNKNLYDFSNIEIVPEVWGLNHDVLLELIHHKNKEKSMCFHLDGFYVYQYEKDQFQHKLFFKDGNLVHGTFFDTIIENKLAKSKKI
jgi:hypothetical protein